MNRLFAWSSPRVLALWREKLALTLGLTVLVSVPYFALQHIAFFPVFIMPETGLDRLVPFVPDAAWVYQSLYLFMPLGPIFLTCPLALRRYALGLAGLSLGANLLYVFFPTSVIRPVAPDAGGLYRMMICVDSPRHACPSLHAAFALYALLWSFRSLPRRPAVLATLWCLAILYSTLATKQHVVLDLLAGLLLGGLTARFVWPRLHPSLPNPKIPEPL